MKNRLSPLASISIKIVVVLLMTRLVDPGSTSPGRDIALSLSFPKPYLFLGTYRLKHYQVYSDKELIVNAWNN